MLCCVNEYEMKSMDLARWAMLGSVLAACAGVFWSRGLVQPSGMCHFTWTGCQPRALCDLQWVDGSPTCARVPPKIPAHHPPIPASGAGTFCGLALDERGHIVLKGFREWGIYDWGIAIGIFNWCVVAALYMFDWFYGNKEGGGEKESEAAIPCAEPTTAAGESSDFPSGSY